MIPAFRISVDGEDATGRIADRLLSLRVVDNDGSEADRLELELDDRDGALAFPDIDSTLEVSLGFKGKSLEPMGRFTVDGVRGSGPTATMQIVATAADLKGEIREPKTRGWEGKSLADIVRTIAGEAGLKPLIGESLAGIGWGYLAQTAESNLHFLTRIAATVDATAKPAGGTLLVQRRGDGKTAAGDVLVTPVVDAARLSSWNWEFEGREIWRKVDAEWCDTNGGQTHRLSRGNGTPVRRLRHVYASEAEAIRAAEASLKGADRAAMKLDATLAGFEPDLLAGASVALTGLRSELNGDWHLTQAKHELAAGGLLTSFKAKKGKT